MHTIPYLPDVEENQLNDRKLGNSSTVVHSRYVFAATSKYTPLLLEQMW